MPRRRMTVARILQIKQFQIAGVKSRAKVPRWAYTGKNMTVHHWTSEKNAASILASQKFKQYPVNRGSSRLFPVMFTNHPTQSKFAGPVRLTTRINRKNLVSNIGVGELGSGARWYGVHADAITGKIIRTS